MGRGVALSKTKSQQNKVPMDINSWFCYSSSPGGGGSYVSMSGTTGIVVAGWSVPDGADYYSSGGMQSMAFEKSKGMKVECSISWDIGGWIQNPHVYIYLYDITTNTHTQIVHSTGTSSYTGQIPLPTNDKYALRVYLSNIGGWGWWDAKVASARSNYARTV